MKLNSAFEAEHTEATLLDFGLGEVYTVIEFKITVEDNQFFAELIDARSKYETYDRNYLVGVFGKNAVEDLEERVGSEYS